MAAPSLGDARHSVRVYLPPSYDEPDARSRRYPVLILLHGWPGGDGNWPGEGKCAEMLDSLSARGAIPELIAVMPNGNGVGTFGRSLWLNSADGRSRMEDFVVNDLVAWADSNFRTRADAADRIVIGLSDGGTAAFNLVIRHPDRFVGAGSLSGRFRLRKQLGMNSALVGSGDAAQKYLAANSPATQIEGRVGQLRQQRLYVNCGLEDEDLDDNRAFHAALELLGIPHVYQEFPGGHGWGYWRTHLRDALLVLAGPMRRR
jgi:putative tributyrin esterase